MNDITLILKRVEQGESNAAFELLPLVYAELRRLAAHKMSNERSDHTLQPTALVHEAWLRLGQSDRQEWSGREHYFRAAAEAMRRILVESARRKLRLRHGGDHERVHLKEFNLPIAEDDEKCLLVHEVLDRFAEIYPRKAEVVKMRMFIGLENHEIALALNTSEKTILRDWSFAKGWLSREIRKAQ